MSEVIENVVVKTNPEYRVSIGRNILESCGERLREIISPCKMAVVTDSNVAPLYLDRVAKSLQSVGFSVCSFVFPAGEASKNIDTFSRILEFLAEEHITRSDCVVALGGGVVGDTAGFSSAAYLRGIRYVQLPTTLLAAVDSSVGGKTAIDLRAGKNLAGAFLQPTAVLCDVDCLNTLSDDIFSDGAAEVIKTGILADEGMLAALESNCLYTNPAEIIKRCVQYKAGVVERDEREQGERRLLNLGHTVGHAIEKCSGYTIPHGHSVAVGTAIIARASARLGWTEHSVAGRICSCLAAHGLAIDTSLDAEQLTAAALSDKKRLGDSITLVIPERIGHCVLKAIPIEQLNAVIAAGLE